MFVSQLFKSKINDSVAACEYVARDICARVEFAGESLERASEALIVDTMLPVEGYGAVIAMEPSGKVVFVSTTANLKRGVMTSTSPARVAIYTDENVN